MTHKTACWQHTWWRGLKLTLLWLPSRLNKPALQSTLSAALLTDEEMKGGPESWALYPDPFFDGDAQRLLSKEL